METQPERTTMNPSEQTPSPADIFRSAWAVYRKIVDNDYMFHREIYADLSSFLQRRFRRQPFAMLELGCGDAHETMQAVRGCELSQYVGVDLSEPALQLAADHVADLPCPTRLIQADMLAGLAQVDEPVDVVFSGFALHHLPAPEKQEFFALSRRALKPGGVLVLTDVMREPHQDRQRYLDDYLRHAARHWRALEPAELFLVSEHIRTCDFPESAALHQQLARNSGLAAGRRLNQHTWHQSWAFERAPESAG